MAKTKQSTSNASSIRKKDTTYEDTFVSLAGKDNPPVDEELIEEIKAGEVELTDKLFLKLLKISSAYLRAEPFKDKYIEWTIEQNLKMLKNIQTAISPERRGRKALDDEQILEKYNGNIKLLEQFKKENQGKSNHALNESFRTHYPEYQLNFRRHRTEKALAIDLTIYQTGISERKLRDLMKQEKETKGIKTYKNAARIIQESMKKHE
ncbi:MAG: hypothetical protein JW943_10445 [Deltaproteobacteria bacterium]|nr:hypothetical protein [Deltaproteobacteria bacterium]